MKRDGACQSLWQHSDIFTPSNTTIPSEDFDVLIIGAGITGITTGYILQKSGLKCIIAEAHNVGFGTTGGTTAHLNTFFDSSYDTIITNFGIDNANLLADAARQSMKTINDNIIENSIDCEYKEREGYIFSVEEEQNKILEDLVEGTKKVGLPINFINDSPFPIPYLKIACIENQAQFNPILYVNGLAKAFEMNGGVIIENCMVNDIKEDEVHIASTTLGNIKAKNAVYATHIPPGVNILHFRCAPYRSYAMAVKLKDNNYPQAMGYDLCNPYHYYRTQEIDNKKFLIAGGEDHKTGHEENTNQCFRKLESYINKYYPVESIAYKWSSQYFEPVDGLPYIGHLPGNRKNVYTATGFSGNGMIFGTLSAIILHDLIITGDSKYKNLFNPARIKPVAGFTNFIKEAADVVAHFIGDKLVTDKISELAEIAPGEAKVVKYDGHTLAIYKDENSNLHAVNSACTHIKCTVAWNNAEKSWDCPCHGSRFGMDGEVLTGPARRELEKIELNH